MLQQKQNRGSVFYQNNRLALCFSLLFCAYCFAPSPAQTMVMGKDYAAEMMHQSSHAETETPMGYSQLRANSSKIKNKKILNRALGLPKPPRPPMAGLTNLPGASYPSYADVPLLAPYMGAKTISTPQPALPPPWPGGPSAPGVYGDHSITELGIP